MIVLTAASSNFNELKLWVWQIAGLKPSVFPAILEKNTLEGYLMMYFLTLKETLVTILNLVTSLLSCNFD